MEASAGRSGCVRTPGRRSPLQGAYAALMEKPSCSDEQHADEQETDVPRKRSSEFIPDLVHLEYVVIDQAFCNVEYPPSQEN